MITILCGKSGSGKDYISKKLIDKGYIPIISWTSRPMRENEIDGREYHFCTRREFEYMIETDKLLEYRSYNTLYNGINDTWFYGLLKEKLDNEKNYVVILDLKGTKEFIKYYGKDNCKVFYIEASDKIRTERAMKRGSFDKTEWERRLIADGEDFGEEKFREIEVDVVRVRNEGDGEDDIIIDKLK